MLGVSVSCWVKDGVCLHCRRPAYSGENPNTVVGVGVDFPQLGAIKKCR
jgi:hypothetical protein